MPGTKQCSGALIQTCNGSGQWDTAIACGAVQGATVACDSGTKACIATCTGTNFDCDLNMANGCEVDASSDANNCGVCGHSCCGGACGSGTCGVYDTGVYGAVYDVDANNRYSTYNPAVGTVGYEINKMPRTGGSSTIIASNQPVVRAIDVFGTNVFWSVNGTVANNYQDVGIYSQPISGGTPTHYMPLMDSDSLLITATDIFTKRVDSAGIYYIPRSNDGSYNLLFGATLPDGSVNVNATYAAPFVTDGQYLYATYLTYPASNQWPIVRSPIHGGATPGGSVTTFANYAAPTGSVRYYALSTEGTNLYYLMFVGAEPVKNGLWKQPFAGGPATQLISNGGGIVASIATDGSNVYYADGNAKQIRKISVNGGSSSLIATLPSSPGNSLNFKITNECLYWYWANTGTIRASAVSP